MKNLGLYILLLFVFFSCKETPESIAEKYLLALKENNFEEAKKYSSDEMIAMLDYSEKKNLDMSKSYSEIKNIKCKSDTLIAECTFCCVLDTCERSEIVLKKIDSKWKVIPIKETSPCDEESAEN